MPKNWTEITTDEILNYDRAETAVMAQYERIMSQKMRETTIELNKGVNVLGDKVTAAANAMVDTLSKTNRFIHNSSEEIIKSNLKISEAQGKLQKMSIVLSVVICLATIAYVFITWKSVSTMQEANLIQKELLAFQQKAKTGK